MNTADSSTLTGPFYADRRGMMYAGSLPLKIASAAGTTEGSGQATSPEFVAFLQVAIGSARELDYHLLLARDLELLSPGDHAALEARTDQVLKMLVALQRTVAKDGHARNRSRMETGKTRGRTNPE